MRNMEEPDEEAKGSARESLGECFPGLVTAMGTEFEWCARHSAKGFVHIIHLIFAVDWVDIFAPSFWT